MKAHPKEIKDKVLELLQKNRSLREIEDRTGILQATVEDWAARWRSEGLLTAYQRKGAAHTATAKRLSNGLYSSIRKKYLNMRDCDKIAGREFGFNNQIESVGYFIDENGVARPCAYCGALAPFGKVWGLDRMDSNLGHGPGNLLPCCGINFYGKHLSCQMSKSHFDLRAWLKMSMARALGHAPDESSVDTRLYKLMEQAFEITQYATSLCGAQELALP